MTVHRKVAAFCARFRLDIPIMLAPMAGVSAPGLSAAVMTAGGMGALGALLMQPSEIADWVAAVRRSAEGAFQLNLDPGSRSGAGRGGRGRGPRVPARLGAGSAGNGG